MMENGLFVLTFLMGVIVYSLIEYQYVWDFRMLSLSSSALQNSFDKVCSVLYLSRPVWRAVEAEVVVEDEEEVAAVDRC